MGNSEALQLLSGSALFGALPEAVRAQVVERLEVVACKLGDTILRQGQPGDAFFLLGQGKVRIVDESGEKPVTLAVLKKGDGFGERSLLYGEPVSATVRAAGSVVLFRLGAGDFRGLLDANPALKAQVDEATAKQREFNFLKTQNLLSGLTPEETARLVGAVETRTLATGDWLFREGEPGDAMFLVREGALRVVKESAGGQVLGYKRAGSLLGEMALLNDEPRSAGAMAVEPALLLRLSREAYQQVVAQKDNVRELLAEQASRHVLQQEAILAGAEQEGDAAAADLDDAIRIGRLRPRGRWFGSLPLAQTDNPLLEGIACLAMIARRVGREFDWRKLAEVQLETGRGDDLHSLSRKAESAGLISRLVRTDAPGVRDLVLPGVVQDAEGRLRVVYAIDRRGVTIADPRVGLATIPFERFARDFDGNFLTIAFVPDFGATGLSVSGVFRQFVPLVRPQAGILGRILVVLLLIEVLGLLPPFFTQVLIDNVLVVGDWNLLWLMLLGLLVATFVASVASLVKDFLALHLVRRLSATLFVRFFAHILALPTRSIQRWDTGALLERFEENEKFLETTSNGTINVLSNASATVLYLPVLYFMNVKLAAIATLFLAAMVIAILIATPRVRAFERLQFQTSADKQSHVIEVVSSIETVKALGQEKEFTERGRKVFDTELDAEMRGERFDNHFEILMDVLQDGATIVVLLIGAQMVLAGQMSAGELIAFVAVLAAVMDPAEALANFYDEFLELKVALDRLNDVLAAPREPLHADRPCPPLKGAIRMEKVSFRYAPDGPDVLKDIDLEIRAGQKIAFVGRSGSGKTTLVGLVNRMLEPTAGTVYLDGIDISKVDLVTLRQQVGVVEQFPYLFSGSVRENIAKANPSLALEAVVGAATLAGVGEFVDRLPMRYETRIGEGGRVLSGGQRQRMVIARALATNPGILVLDEATSALDTESERIIQKNLDLIMQGRTTLAIAHRLSTIRNADLIVVLDAGRVAEKGTHDELMAAKGLYHYLATRTR